jgi:hypothetical protein
LTWPVLQERDPRRCAVDQVDGLAGLVHKFDRIAVAFGIRVNYGTDRAAKIDNVMELDPSVREATKSLSVTHLSS